MFQENREIKISRKTKVGDKIFSVKAIDYDKAPYKTVKYKIYSENLDQNFPNVASINETTGDITLMSIPKGHRNVL